MTEVTPSFAVYTQPGFEIRYHWGRWIVNGKKIQDLDTNERQFFNDFFKNQKLIY